MIISSRYGVRIWKGIFFSVINELHSEYKRSEKLPGYPDGHTLYPTAKFIGKNIELVIQGIEKEDVNLFPQIPTFPIFFNQPSLSNRLNRSIQMVGYT